MNYKSLNCLSKDIIKNLHKIHNGNYDLIVGIPRSGMIPAYTIGLYLNINVIDIDGFIENRPLKKGRTRKTKDEIFSAHDAKKVLIVDDSIMSGSSLKAALDKIPKPLIKKITTLAIYSDKKNRNDVGFFLETVPAPRVFEWNIFHRDLISKACVDIDGVLCSDPTNEENDDGEKYINFLTNAKPHILPTYKIHSLVTNRLEKYRPQTEFWLQKHGITYENLIMLDLPNKEARQKSGSYAEHKASYFKKSKDLEIFIESEIWQAQEIMKITGKPVYCVDENIMLSPNSFISLVHNPSKTIKNSMYFIYEKIPGWLKPLAKKTYNSLKKIKNNKKSGE